MFVLSRRETEAVRVAVLMKRYDLIVGRACCMILGSILAIRVCML